MVVINRILLLGLLFLGLLTASTAGHADDRTVRLTSLDWPPYTGSELPDGGASVVVARAAFEAMGYELEVSFYPWNRAVNLARDGERYHGYFPEYYASSIEAEFHFSDAMGSGPLGLAEQADNPFEWDSIEDLHGLRIGVVSGYVNTDAFDAAVAAGDIQGMEAPADSNNLRMLQAGRLQMTVIDQNVMNYLLATELPDAADSLSFNPRLLEDKSLHICFSRTERGEELVEIFNQGLEKIDVEALMQSYFDRL